MVRTLRGFPPLLSALRDLQEERVRWDPRDPIRAIGPSHRKEREPGPEAQGSAAQAWGLQHPGTTTWEPAGAPGHSLQACTLPHPSFQLSDTLIISQVATNRWGRFTSSGHSVPAGASPAPRWAGPPTSDTAPELSVSLRHGHQGGQRRGHLSVPRGQQRACCQGPG